MATTTRRTIAIDELPEVLKRRSREPIPSEVIEHRRQLSAAVNEIVDAMEPLEEDVKDIVRRQRAEERPGRASRARRRRHDRGPVVRR